MARVEQLTDQRQPDLAGADAFCGYGVSEISNHLECFSTAGRPMDKRKLGHTGFAVAPLAFGGNVFGWTVDEATALPLLDAFVVAGFNLIDTADSYSRWVVLPENR